MGGSTEFFSFSKQVVEDGYEFFAKRQLVTLFSAPNYCGEFDNAGAMMSVDETLMCSFQVKVFPSVEFFTVKSMGLVKKSVLKFGPGQLKGYRTTSPLFCFSNVTVYFFVNHAIG